MSTAAKLERNWHRDIEEELFTFLAAFVKGFNELTLEQANAWRLEALNTIEGNLLAGDSPSYEVDKTHSATGVPIIYYPNI